MQVSFIEQPCGVCVNVWLMLCLHLADTDVQGLFTATGSSATASRKQHGTQTASEIRPARQTSDLSEALSVHGVLRLDLFNKDCRACSTLVSSTLPRPIPKLVRCSVRCQEVPLPSTFVLHRTVSISCSENEKTRDWKNTSFVELVLTQIGLNVLQTEVFDYTYSKQGTNVGGCCCHCRDLF